jgi:hypothetical protein
MSGYALNSTKYELTDELTEWDDILIAKGVQTRDDRLFAKGLDPEQHQIKEKVAEVEAPTRDEIIEAHATTDDIDELEEEAFDDTTILEKIRAKRLKEMQDARLKARFGEVYEITKPDYVREVTECSNTKCWVICCLYEDHIPMCTLMLEAMEVCSKKFKDIKFVKIKSRQAVENMPESQLPALFLYRDGKNSIQEFTGKNFGGMSMKPANLEWYLAKLGLCKTELESNPLHSYIQKKVKKVMKASEIKGLDSDDEAVDDVLSDSDDDSLLDNEKEESYS